jgi:hypothetical protein
VDPYDLVSESYYTPCTLEKLSDVNCSIDRDATHFNTPNVLTVRHHNPLLKYPDLNHSEILEPCPYLTVYTCLDFP